MDESFEILIVVGERAKVLPDRDDAAFTKLICDRQSVVEALGMEGEEYLANNFPPCDADRDE